MQYLTSLKRFGVTDTREKISLGAFTLPCVACPHPGINLPENYRDTTIYPDQYALSYCRPSSSCLNDLLRYRYVFARTLALDGNFTAQHLKYRTDTSDIGPAPGSGYMIPMSGEYVKHLKVAAKEKRVRQRRDSDIK